MQQTTNHTGATELPQAVSSYLIAEVNSDVVLGPFHVNPFNHPIAISHLNMVPKKNGHRRIFLDLSWQHGASVNDFIHKNEYLNELFRLVLPGVDQLVSLIVQKGCGCLLYKREQAY